MKFNCYLNYIVGLFLLSGAEAFGQENIEEQDGLGLLTSKIITEEDQWTFEVGLSYSAYSRDSNTSYYSTIQTNDGKLIDIPLAIGDSQYEKDLMVFSIGGRYGLTDKTELYSKIKFLYKDERIEDGITGEISQTARGEFSSFVLGVNHHFWEDDETFGLVGFGDIALAENISLSGTEVEYGKSATLGLTTYKTFDPVVLSATFGWHPAFSRAVGEDEVNPGDTFFLNPNISFAVNNEITLTGGVSMLFSGSDSVNGKDIGVRTTRGDMDFGVIYSLDKDTSLHFDTTIGIVGVTTMSTGISVSKTF